MTLCTIPAEGITAFLVLGADHQILRQDLEDLMSGPEVLCDIGNMTASSPNNILGE